MSLICYVVTVTIRHYIKILGGIIIPKTTFLHLNVEKRQNIEFILLDVLYNQPLSQVKVSEIISRMNMSRGAFYKYFEDLSDANEYLISIVARDIHIDIMKFINQSEDALFDGIANYLTSISQLDHVGTKWKQVKFLTQSDQLHFSKRRKTPSESDMFEDWFNILKMNQLDIQNEEDAIRFLYFMMSIVMGSLTEYVANDWDTDTLLLEYDRKMTWLLHGLLKTKGE